MSKVSLRLFSFFSVVAIFAVASGSAFPESLITQTKIKNYLVKHPSSWEVALETQSKAKKPRVNWVAIPWTDENAVHTEIQLFIFEKSLDKTDNFLNISPEKLVPAQGDYQVKKVSMTEVLTMPQAYKCNPYQIYSGAALKGAAAMCILKNEYEDLVVHLQISDADKRDAKKLAELVNFFHYGIQVSADKK
jgi:hypothetical protein